MDFIIIVFFSFIPFFLCANDFRSELIIEELKQPEFNRNTHQTKVLFVILRKKLDNNKLNFYSNSTIVIPAPPN